MRYRNLDLEASAYDEATARFAVRVLSSPAGEQPPAAAEQVQLPAELPARLAQLEARSLDLPGLINLGELLAGLLFPPGARALLDASRARLADDEGLRIRLRLGAFALADLPWEYAYLPRPDTPANQRGPDGFLVLDHRISLVRYELQGQPPGTLDPVKGGALRLVALLAGPQEEDFPTLDLAAERASLERTFATLPAVTPEFFPDATADSLQDALNRPTHVFHFVGHGLFDRQTGEGYLVLLDEECRAAPMNARRLALNLAGRGVRLAVLGACEGGRRDQTNAWTGIAPALTRAGIPAVIGMQYDIQESTASAFSRRLYRDLAAGQPVDAAVTAARLAIFNRTPDEERDWGVPVLYLRAEEGTLFPMPEAAAPPPAVIAAPVANTGESIGHGLAALAALLQAAQVRAAVVEFRADFQNACRQIVSLAEYKGLHDRFQRFEAAYNNVYHAQRRLLRESPDDTAWEDLERNEPELGSCITDLVSFAGQASFAASEALWLAKLNRARGELAAAINGYDSQQLKSPVRLFQEVLGREPSRTNTRLVAAARALRLSTLIAALTTVRGCLVGVALGPAASEQLADFEAGVAELTRLEGQLTWLVDVHDNFQAIDDELRKDEVELEFDALRLQDAWQDVMPLIERLYTASEVPWVGPLRSLSDVLTTTLVDANPVKIKRTFRAYHSEASRVFNQVDADLLGLCGELQKVGEPLAQVLRMVQDE